MKFSFSFLYSPWIQHWASFNSSKFEFFSSHLSVLRYHISMSSIYEVDFKAISMFCILNIEMVMNWNPPYSVFIYPYVHTLNNSIRKFLAINSIIKLPNFFLHGNNTDCHSHRPFETSRKHSRRSSLEKPAQLSPRGKNTTSKMNVQSGEDVLADLWQLDTDWQSRSKRRGL